MLKIFPCARYHAHMEAVHAQQRQLAPTETPLPKDSSFCAYAIRLDPVSIDVPDVDAQFWECPCARAKEMRNAKNQRKAIEDAAYKNPAHLVRVRALIELADLVFQDKPVQ